ncbi:SH3 beta-barrel fold-containing protein [Chryseobacterium sp.]|uniref:SH3 beta-barrel fold-containing protein n=1 Tax=Chryseobacterium sp. TaxID=1871047 RepID=UPI0011CA727A|nr:SH3 beta-barrel fold-containing protein [Chryseobacterium sp.]TXF75920.1 DUF2693 domain-containing protein [Chryseobacterium sp.]
MKTFRSQVFLRAYEIMSGTGKAFAVCLSKAWQLYRLSKEMATKEEVCFTYEKKDGTLRKAYGTLKNVAQFVKGNGVQTPKVFNYWDLEAAAFRSFKVENFIAVVK